MGHTLLLAAGAVEECHRGRHEAAFLSLEPLRKGVVRALREWGLAKAQFAVIFGQHLTRAMSV